VKQNARVDKGMFCLESMDVEVNPSNGHPANGLEIYVTNLDFHVSDDHLWELFIQIGDVLGVVLRKAKATRSESASLPKSHALVEFRIAESVDYGIV
jgi:hypothetical protein